MTKKKESYLIAFFALLTLIFGYLCSRLAAVPADWFALGVVVFPVPLFLLKKRFRWQTHMSYAAMGILTYLVLFTLLRDLISLATGSLLAPYVVWLLTLATTGIGFVCALTGPRIKKITVPLPLGLEALHGLSIAQISDLHIGATISRSYVENVVRKVNSQNVDIVALTGDIGDGEASLYKDAALPLRHLKSRLGSFYVTGNHEYYWNANEWLTLTNNLGIVNLINRGKLLSYGHVHVLMAGIPDPVSGLLPDLYGIQETSAAEKANYKILLSHRPGIYPEAAKAGYQLQLSGHTHGGQFFPWTIVVGYVHRLSKGLHRVQDMHVYVSQGTGSWGPFLRLGTSTEITLLTLSAQSDTSLRKI